MCNLGEITNNYAVTVGQSNRSEYKLCGAELPVKVTKQGCQPRADIATMQSHCLNVTAEVSCAKGKNHYKRKQKNQYDYGLFLHTLGQAVCLADHRVLIINALWSIKQVCFFFRY